MVVLASDGNILSYYIYTPSCVCAIVREREIEMWVWVCWHPSGGKIYQHHMCTLLRWCVCVCVCMCVCKRERERKRACATRWRRRIGCLIPRGHFPQKSPRISGSLAKSDLQLKASDASSLSCSVWREDPLILYLYTSLSLSLSFFQFLLLSHSLSLSPSDSVCVCVSESECG